MGFTSNLLKMNHVLEAENKILQAQLNKAAGDIEKYRKAVLEITQIEPVKIDGVTFIQLEKVIKIFTDNLKNLQ